MVIDKELVEVIYQRNDDDYTILKAIEELNELATELTKSLTKPHRVDPKDITSEISDVMLRLELLKKLYNTQDISDSLKSKQDKWRRWVKENKYKNI